MTRRQISRRQDVPSWDDPVPAPRLVRSRQLYALRPPLTPPETPSRAAAGAGRKLPAEVRLQAERAYGHDFSEVRVLEDARPAGMGALAYARGNQLHFQPGRYQPGTESGRGMIQHELAHVVQQREGRLRGASGAVIRADEALEREADVMSAKVRAGYVSPKSADQSAARAPVGDAIQALWIKLVDGKVRYHAREEPQKDPQQAGYFWMDDDKFATWKGAGKRYGSDKWTDPDTGRNYWQDGNKFYDGQGQEVQRGQHWIDRTRRDRRNQDVAEYDVDSYQALKNREASGDKLEHDHVPSGESRKQYVANRNGSNYDQDQAYKKAMAIEIYGRAKDTVRDHADASATFGGRQGKKDTNPYALKLADRTKERKDMDADLSEAAFFRDVRTMLDRTAHNRPDATNRLQQLGAYRSLYRQNLSNKRGQLRPDSDAMDFQGDAIDDKGVTYQKILGKTSGRQMDEYFTGRIHSDVAPQPPPRQQLMMQQPMLQPYQSQQHGHQIDDEEIKVDAQQRPVLPQQDMWQQKSMMQNFFNQRPMTQYNSNGQSTMASPQYEEHKIGDDHQSMPDVESANGRAEQQHGPERHSAFSFQNEDREREQRLDAIRNYAIFMRKFGGSKETAANELFLRGHDPEEIFQVLNDL